MPVCPSKLRYESLCSAQTNGHQRRYRVRDFPPKLHLTYLTTLQSPCLCVCCEKIFCLKYFIADHYHPVKVICYLPAVIIIPLADVLPVILLSKYQFPPFVDQRLMLITSHLYGLLSLYFQSLYEFSCLFSQSLLDLKALIKLLTQRFPKFISLYYFGRSLL